jgi:tetratricopeptide (TPR) repeat protein
LSYRAIHREIVGSRMSRGIPELPVYNTVYRCFQVGRARIDVELLVDIARILLGDQVAAERWRRAWQVVIGRATAATIVEVFGSLPDDLAAFTGRDQELKQILEGGAATWVIEGMPGIGKTRLAVHAAHLLSRRRRFGIVLSVDLRGFDPDRPPADPAALLEGFLRQLGLPGDQIHHLDLSARAAKFRQLLNGNPAMILLDNAAGVAQVAPVLPAPANCLILVTSRRALAELPGVQRLPLDVLTPDEALELLTRSSGVDIAAVDSDAAVRIAELLGGLPIALDVMAARIRANPEWTLADHLERLVHLEQVLQLEDAVELPFRLSYEDLPADQRQLLRLLALHPGSDIEGYAAAALTGTEPPAAQRNLTEVTGAHLLHAHSSGRFRFHDLIRLYATGRTRKDDPAGVRHAALTRLLDHYCHAAMTAMDLAYPYEIDRRPRISAPATATPEFLDADAATAWLDTEQANLLAAAILAAGNGWPTHAHQLAQTLDRHLRTRARYSDARTLHEQALEAVHRAGDRTAEQAALTSLAHILYLQDRDKAAVARLEEALALARDIDHRLGQHAALVGLGHLHYLTGGYGKAADRFEEALAIACDLGHRQGEHAALIGLGHLNDARGLLDAAAENFEQALAIARDLGHRPGEFHALIGLGNNLRANEKLESAASRYAEALDLARASDHRANEVYALYSLGHVLRAQQRFGPAAEHYERAIAIAVEIENRNAEFEARYGLAEVHRAAGDTGEALREHRAALELATTLGQLPDQARAHDGLATTYHALGQPDAARLHWQHAIGILDHLGLDEAEQVRAGDIRAHLANLG